MTYEDVSLRAPLRVRVLSPVHIGTGEAVNSKGFLLVGDTVHVVDERRFLAIATHSRRMQAEFERFCLEESSLREFLRDHHLEIEAISQYHLRKMGQQVGRSILPFLKAPGVAPCPYLPGSSLKGALRSAFLRAHLLTDAEAKEVAESKVRERLPDGKPKRADDALEEWFFGRDHHHDWMRLLQFTDTRPVGFECLEVADVRVFSSTTNHTLQEKRFVLSPEVLTVETELQGELVVHQFLAQQLAEQELAFKQRLPVIADFAKACDQVAQEQIAQETEFYASHQRHALADWYRALDERRKRLRPDEFECLLRVGWGTGYDDKTISDVFDQETFDDIRNTYGLPVGRPGRRGRPLKKALSPKSRKLAIARRPDGGEELLPMGWLLLKAL